MTHLFLYPSVTEANRMNMHIFIFIVIYVDVYVVVC
jgi:hypothetical protein